MSIHRIALVGFSLAFCSPLFAQDPGEAPAVDLEDPELSRDLSPERAREALDKSLGYLLEEQHEDGSWGAGVPMDLRELGFAWDTFYAWNQASNAIVLMALLAAPPTQERELALERGLDWLCTTRLAHRGAGWDVDSTWASLFGFTALVDAAGDPRFTEGPRARAIEQRAMAYYADLVSRQTPLGGWAYYDDPPITTKPTWATSFCTALILPALIKARDDLGWEIDSAVISRGVGAVQRCKLPNGAYTYDVNLVPRGHGGDSINQVPGSLGRIQVCNWSLARAGDPRITTDLVREGLEEFFRFHHFMDMTRTKPIPHEGPFANAGYFYFFGHYYAARAIELLPPEEQELMHRRLRYHVTKTQTARGASTDFLTSAYVVNACTAFGALTLAAGLQHDNLTPIAAEDPAPSAPKEE
ncbi:MAG: hypothetical protein ABGY71_10160 [bacterium]|nr:hypothetical protein [Planctomycetota bacterium]HIL50678.1 hypothetical protein [Planctomycetota bacterium]